MMPFTDWQTFYEVVGSAAGALTGLQFVTMALVADMPLSPEESEIGANFATPSIVHFGMVLFVSALVAMPWRSVVGPPIIWGVAGLCGLIYTCVVWARVRSQSAYKATAEDWIFRVVLPLVGYGTLGASAALAFFALRTALFVLAATALVLLFNGIYNAWDNVTYIVFVKHADLQARNAGQRSS